MSPLLPVGGPAPLAALYVSRAVDEALFLALSEGTPAVLLATPGAGKSSLALRLQERLLSVGTACAYVSLTEISGDLGADGWFLALAQLLATRLGLPDPTGFWKREHDLPPGMRWQRFLRVEVLGRLFGKVVLLLDAMELSLRQPFLRAELPGALRAVRDGRGMDVTWARLSTCLLGSPAAAELGLLDLGRTFVVPDFTPEDAVQLLPALSPRLPDAELWLDAVLGWTAGHPGLTLQLCQALPEGERPLEPSPGEAAAYIEKLARRVLCGPGGFTAPLLQSIEEHFRTDAPRAGALLSRYRRLLAQGPAAAQADDPLERALCSLGLAQIEGTGPDARILPRCRLLSLLFDDAWAARRESDRQLFAQVAAWIEQPDDPSRLLRGDDLLEALRWAEGREDVSTTERTLLLRSLEQARRDDDRLREEQGVKEDLRYAKERAAKRRLSIAVLSVLLTLIVGLLGTIAYLSWGRTQARREREAAERERADVRMHLRGALDDLERERTAHRQTSAQRDEARATLEKARAQMDEVRGDLGDKEARLKEVGGKVESIFKQRIVTKGARPGANTGINPKIVDGIFLGRGWPAVRRCYPIRGPLPQRLRAELTVQPDGRVSDVGHSDEGAAKACVTGALRGLRFPSFGGAHFVRLTYVYLRPKK